MKGRIKPFNGFSLIEALIGMVILLLAILGGYAALKSLTSQNVANTNQIKSEEAIQAVADYFFHKAGDSDAIVEGSADKSEWFDHPEAAGTYFSFYNLSTNEHYDVFKDPGDPNDPRMIEVDASHMKLTATVEEMNTTANSRALFIKAEWKESLFGTKTKERTFALTNSRPTKNGAVVQGRVVNALTPTVGVRYIVVMGPSVRAEDKSIPDIKTFSDSLGYFNLEGIAATDNCTTDPINIYVKGDERPGDQPPFYFKVAGWENSTISKTYPVCITGEKSNYWLDVDPDDDTSKTNIQMWPFGKFEGYTQGWNGSAFGVVNDIGVDIIPIITDIKAWDVPLRKSFTHVTPPTPKGAGYWFAFVPAGKYRLNAVGTVGNNPRFGEPYNDYRDTIQVPDMRDKWPNSDGIPWRIVFDPLTDTAPGPHYAAISRAGILGKHHNTLDPSYPGLTCTDDNCFEIASGQTINRYSAGTGGHADKNHNKNTHFYLPKMGDLVGLLKGGVFNSGSQNYEVTTTVQSGLMVNARVVPYHSYKPVTFTGSPAVYNNYNTHPVFNSFLNYVAVRPGRIDSYKTLLAARTDPSGNFFFYNSGLKTFSPFYRKSVSPSDSDQFLQQNSFELFPYYWGTQSGAAGDKFAPVIILTDPDDINNQRMVAWLGNDLEGAIPGEGPYTVIPSNLKYGGFDGSRSSIKETYTGYEEWAKVLHKKFLVGRQETPPAWVDSSGNVNTGEILALKRSQLSNAQGNIYEAGSCTPTCEPWFHPVDQTKAGVVSTWGIEFPAGSSYLNTNYSVTTIPLPSPGPNTHTYNLQKVGGVNNWLPRVGAGATDGDGRYLRFILNDDGPDANAPFYGSLKGYSKEYNSGTGAVDLNYLDSADSVINQFRFAGHNAGNMTPIFTNNPIYPPGSPALYNIGSNVMAFRLNNIVTGLKTTVRHEAKVGPTPVNPSTSYNIDLMVNPPFNSFNDVYVKLDPQNTPSGFVDTNPGNGTDNPGGTRFIYRTQPYPTPTAFAYDWCTSLGQYCPNVPGGTNDPYARYQITDGGHIELVEERNFGDISGQVNDETGTPMGGIRINLYVSRNEQGVSRWKYVGRMYTNATEGPDKGKYKILPYSTDPDNLVYDAGWKFKSPLTNENLRMHLIEGPNIAVKFIAPAGYYNSPLRQVECPNTTLNDCIKVINWNFEKLPPGASAIPNFGDSTF